MKRNDWLRTRKDKDGNILYRSPHAVREEPATGLAVSKVRGGDGGARERRVGPSRECGTLEIKIFAGNMVMW